VEVDAFLADSVEAIDGKIYALGGGWDVLHGASVPLRHPRIGLAVLVRVPYTATNQEHRVEISLRDADENYLPLVEGPDPDNTATKIGTAFNIGRPPHLTPGSLQTVPLAMNLDGLVFKEPGNYNFVIEIDGSVEKRLSLRVISQPSLGLQVS
jgi:hypothetical protein